MTEGICDFALQLPGPSHKTGYNYHTTDLTHDKTGVTIHTAEYDVAQWDEQVLYNALFSGRIASWHFTITKEGWLFQHYPVNAVTWHCGYNGNLWTVGIECEGYAPNKISGPQYDLLVKLLQWLRQDRGWRAEWQRAWIDRCGRNCEAALWEHNEIMDGYTACQVFSRGMIDAEQLIRDLKEEPMAEPFTEKQEERIKEIVNWCGPGMEMSARLAITSAFEAGASFAKVGHWAEVKRTLPIIEERMKQWHRWEE